MDPKALVSAVERPDVIEAVKTLQAAFQEMGLHLVIAVVSCEGTDKRTVAVLEPGGDALSNLAASKALRTIADMSEGEFARALN